MEKNRIYCHFAHMAAVLGKARKGFLALFGFYVKKKKSFSNENRKKNSFAFDSLFWPNNEEINGMRKEWESCFETSIFVFDLFDFDFDRLRVSK